MSKNRWLIGFLPLVALIVACGGIHHAVKYQDLDGVKSYVHRGDLNKREKNHGLTPLMLAAYYNHYDIAEYLLEQGARVNKRDKKGRTA
ncbi:MAG: ankyrin repeat domain-containing protein, partial [Desulfobacteraceae bacterium]|nr:ankyrin repeat domain-containing protein [Desulfobacteraceae bacterium]